MRRRAPAVLALVAGLVSLRPQPALAESVQATCSEAYLTAQHLMHDRHLAKAREALLVCARDPCSRALQPECAQWLADVQRSLPSIVILAERGGVELRDVRVALDDRPFLDKLDGTSKDLDPGTHEIRLEAPGAAPVVQSVLIHEGERSRIVRFVVPPLLSPGTEPVNDRAKRVVTFPVYFFTGVAVVGAVGWAYFGVSGLSLRNKIDACESCNASQKQTLDVDWALADTAIGVTLVSLGVATYFFFRPVGQPPGATGATTLLERVAPVLVPRRGGGSLGMELTF